MSNHYIMNDASLIKIKNLQPGTGEALKQFVNFIYSNKGLNTHKLMRNLSDTHVLLASFDAQNLLLDGEKSWKELMNKEDYNSLEKNRYFILGYMLIYENNKETHYIDLFDTTIRNLNVGRTMIKEYERCNNVKLIPQEIIETSAKYWAKVLFDYEDKDGDNHICDYKIQEFIEDYELDLTDLKWEPLFELSNFKNVKSKD